MGRKSKYPTEVRERAVRLVSDQQGQHRSQWAAISSVAGKMGCTPETLRKWVRRMERGQGGRGFAASMEPSTFVDGEALRRCRRVPSDPCFNGAVDVRRQRGARARTTASTSRCFNGAVDVRRRREAARFQNAWSGGRHANGDRQVRRFNGAADVRRWRGSRFRSASYMARSRPATSIPDGSFQVRGSRRIAQPSLVRATDQAS